jgi:hypothetical protein
MYANPHQLIQREQNFFLDKKYITIHSEDRDINKWPNSNTFEILLPDSIKNIQSIQLIQSDFPSNFYTFSNNYKNTKLEFTINPTQRSLTLQTTYSNLHDNSMNNYSIEIQEGIFSGNQLASELQNKMNKVVSDYLDGVGVTDGYDYFYVTYNEVSQKFMFSNSIDAFEFMFSNEIDYETTLCYKNNVFNQTTKWGLPYFLGFEKNNYSSISTTSEIISYYNNTVTVPINTTDVLSTQTPTGYYVESPKIVTLYTDSMIYMEMDKYNSIDELKPYVEDSNSSTNSNDYNGIINSAFAKIPMTSTPNTRVFDSNHNLLNNSISFSKPIDRIKKLKFKFRYHDGRLIDFNNSGFNFTLCFNTLMDEINNICNIRVPTL